MQWLYQTKKMEYLHILSTSPTLADRTGDTVQERNGYLIVFFLSIQITHTFAERSLTAQRLILQQCFSGSNNCVVLIKLVHKRILLKPIQIINLENAALNSKRVAKICCSNGLLFRGLFRKSRVLNSSSPSKHLPAK